MVDKTNTGYGDPKAMVQQAAGIFACHSQRNSRLGQMTGKMPTDIGSATSTIRKQSSCSMPIVRAMDLSKGKGDEVKFNFINPVNAYPIMGSKVAEGRGTGISYEEDKLRVNQARFPVDMGNTMSEIRSPVDLRRLARPIAQDLMDSYVDQSLLVHLAGARGYHNNHEWRVPLESHAGFREMLVNPVKPPTKNRHYIVSGDGVSEFKVNAGEMAITSADVLSLDTIDSMKTVMDLITLPPPCIEVPGDEAAKDEPLRVWMMSPTQYNQFAALPTFRTYQANALARSRYAKEHPLFRGEVGIWNGFLIMKMPKPIRFYKGDTVRYATAHDSEATANAVIAGGFGDNFAVDRSIILGGQALAQAFGRSEKSGIPFFYKEKEMDHGDKMECLIGAIWGVSKIRFGVDVGDGQQEFTDYGVTVVDTAVATLGARK